LVVGPPEEADPLATAEPILVTTAAQSPIPATAADIDKLTAVREPYDYTASAVDYGPNSVAIGISHYW